MDSLKAILRIAGFFTDTAQYWRDRAEAAEADIEEMAAHIAALELKIDKMQSDGAA